MTLITTSITFPIDMPVRADGHHPFETARFDPMYTQTVAPTRGSQMQVANLASDLWMMEFTSHPLDLEEGLQYQSWLQSLRGGLRLFKAWHPLLRYPQFYPDGWTGLSAAHGGAF